MDERMLFYEVIGEFKKDFYKNILTKEHLLPGELHIKKLRFPDGGEDEEANFWGYELVKDGVRYLISSEDNSQTKILISGLLPILPKDLMKVANSRGEVFHWVQKPVKVAFKNEKNHTPKEFLDTLTMISHSNQRQLKLAWMMGLSQMWLRSNYRVVSPGGFGKDSVVETMNALFGNCGTVESPTIAKLEDRASVLKWLVVNEVVGIGRAEWDIIQQFLLATGAHNNEVTKHSRAFQNVKEIIDISSFSLSLFYNDITHYADAEKAYFDKVTKSAVLDRFPAFRFYGKFTQDFSSLINVDTRQFMLKHKEEMKKLLYSFVYYSGNFTNHLHGYNTSKLMDLEGRDKTNMSKLIKVVDVFSESQEEFDGWLQDINNSMLDYVTMVKNYIPAVRNFCKKFRIPWDEVFPGKSKVELSYIMAWLSEHGRKDGKWTNSEYKQIHSFLKGINTNNSTFINTVEKLASFQVTDMKVAAVTGDKPWKWEEEIL